MKHKYRILEKHYDDGSVWFMPQIGDWWHGWRYLCKPHPCPEVDWQRITYKTFEDADAYMRDFIKRDKQGMTSPAKLYSKFPVTTKIHDYTEIEAGCQLQQFQLPNLDFFDIIDNVDQLNREVEMEIIKLKKAPLVYFVQKDRPLRMDYRFGYKRTPESALKYRIGQWWTNHDGKLKRRIRNMMGEFNTREEAEAVMSKYNKELMENCPWEHYEIAK